MKTTLLLICSLFTGVLFAQNGTLKGTVTGEDNEALYGVNVVLDASKGLGTSTDFDGNYSISAPSGIYNVKVGYLGMVDQFFRIELQSGETQTLAVQLVGDAEEIEVIEISATKRGLSREREVVSIETVSSELLLNNNITNGADAVDKVVGVTLLDGQPSIRGGSGYAYGVGSRVILVIDDIPLLSPERSEVLWDFLPMENVKTFDVVKGASSVQYGASALNGIINVNTKWPQKKKETEITLFSTMYDNPPIEEAKWWEYSIQNYRDNPHEMGITAVHRRKINEEMDIVINGTMNSNQSHIQSQSIHKIRNNIKYRFKPKNIEGFTTGINTNVFFRNKDVFFIWEGFDDGAYQGMSFTDKYLRTTFDPYVKYIFKENNRIGSYNRVYYDKRLDSDYYAVSIYNDLQYERKYKRENSKISGSALAGLVNNHSTLRSPSFNAFSQNGDGVFKINNLGTYVQSDFTYDRFSIAAGARFDWISLDGDTKASKPVLNGGVSYKIKKNNYVRASFGQSFRISSPAERFVFEEITAVYLDTVKLPVYAGPNPDVKPESGYSLEMGYKRKFDVKRWEGTIDAVVFYQAFSDMVEFTFGQWSNPATGNTYLGFRSENIAEARIFGWEVSASGNGKIGRFPITVQGGYTYNYPANAEEDPSLNKFGNVFKNAFKAFKITDEEHMNYANGSDRENILNGMLRYRFRHTLKLDVNLEVDDFSFGTNLRYYSYMDRVDQVFATFIPGIQNYRNTLNNNGEVVVDIRSFYKINDKFTMGLIVKNLFNNNYQLRPAKPDMPRTFTLQGRVNF